MLFSLTRVPSSKCLVHDAFKLKFLWLHDITLRQFQKLYYPGKHLLCLSHTHRDTPPGDGKTSVVIREAIDLTRNNRIDLESLKTLHQVQRKNLVWLQIWASAGFNYYYCIDVIMVIVSFKTFLVLRKLPFIRVKEACYLWCIVRLDHSNCA